MLTIIQQVHAHGCGSQPLLRDHKCLPSSSSIARSERERLCTCRIWDLPETPIKAFRFCTGLCCCSGFINSSPKKYIWRLKDGLFLKILEILYSIIFMFAPNFKRFGNTGLSYNVRLKQLRDLYEIINELLILPYNLNAFLMWLH